MIKIVSLLLLLSLILFFLSDANAATVDFSLALNPDGTVTITDYKGYDTKIIIDRLDGRAVSGIGDYAFNGAGSIIEIVLSASVQSVGKGAFANCSSLVGISYMKGQTEIGDSAFVSCKSLTSIVIPDSVTSIGENAFRNCTGLISVTIPEGVRHIGDKAFYACEQLTRIEIYSRITEFGSEVFYGCGGFDHGDDPDKKPVLYGYSGSDAQKYAQAIRMQFQPLPGDIPVTPESSPARTQILPRPSISPPPLTTPSVTDVPPLVTPAPVWSEWQAELPGFVTGDNYTIDQKTQYRFRTRLNIRDNWGSWSEWSDALAESVSNLPPNRLDIETRTQYRYIRTQ